MINRDLQLSAMEAIKFYGSIASTNGVEDETKAIANKNIRRLVDGLGPSVDAIVGALSGIIIVTNEEE